MKTIIKRSLYCICFAVLGLFSSCSETELPDHFLDVEYKYELTCSDMLLKYVTPEVTYINELGVQTTLSINENMWEGNEHKKWSMSVHYDRLDVTSTMTVKYIPRTGVTYQDEPAFDNVHYLSCLILIKEDGNGQRNNYTIIPDFPAKTDVKADALKDYINRLSQSSTTKGGSVDMKGEITKIENN